MKSSLAQHFTPPSLAKLMSDLCVNEGRFLEPSCGHGALVNAVCTPERAFQEIVSIELDKGIAPSYALNQDFFEYPVTEKFDTVIANPPYLNHKEIPESTRSLPMFKQLQPKLGGLANLYVYFILKSFLHLESQGEMTFVVTEEIFRTSSNFKLMNFLHKNGAFTDLIYFKKSPFLPDVSQPVVVFRYEKDNFLYLTDVRVV